MCVQENIGHTDSEKESKRGETLQKYENPLRYWHLFQRDVNFSEYIIDQLQNQNVKFF